MKSRNSPRLPSASPQANGGQAQPLFVKEGGDTEAASKLVLYKLDPRPRLHGGKLAESHLVIFLISVISRSNIGESTYHGRSLL